MKKIVVIGIHAIAMLTLKCHGTVSYIALRSQSNNTARALHERRIASGNYATTRKQIGLTVMYEQSRANTHINQCLFGTDLLGNQNILIQGSHFNNGTRNKHAWLADYFGLPTDFSSVISYNPTVKNSIAELGGWYACPSNSLFIDFQLPLVHTNTYLNACEILKARSELGYLSGYFAEDAIGPDNLLSTAQQFFQSELVPNLGNEIIFNPLQVSKFIFDGRNCHDAQKQTRLADAIIRIGYDAIITENTYLKAYARVSAPAGNKPKSIFLFESIVGNGGHWGLGAGTSGQLSLWDSQECNTSLYVFLDAYAQHLFQTKQKRSFDLKSKSNSRYMLAQRLGALRQNPSLSGPSDAGVEFQNEYAPIANLTYGKVNVAVNIEGEVTARLVGLLKSWQAAIGYNFWGRSAEKLYYASIPCALKDAKWALKGDAQVIGFNALNNDPVRLAAIQNANIQSGTNNFPAGINGIDPLQNPGIINPITATTGLAIDVIAVPFLAATTTNTSNPATTLTACDVDLRGTTGISNSIFGYISYAPMGTCWFFEPRFEIGGQAEFGGSSCRSAKSDSCEHQQFALSTWGFWLTLGAGF